MSVTGNSLKRQIVTGFSSGLVIGVTEVIFSISLAALIYASGPAAYVANDIGLILLGAYRR